MVSTIDAVIDGWRPAQRLDIYQQCRAAVRRSTVESLFGRRLAVHSDFLGKQLQPLLDLTHQLPQVMRTAAADQRTRLATGDDRPRRIDDFIDAQIADARVAPNPDDHVLTMLINGRGEEGYALSDNEIRDSVVSLITAGYETTSGALAWAIYTLLSQPDAWDAAADEVNRVLAGKPPTASRPERVDLPQRRRARDPSAVPARCDLRAPGDA